MKEPLRNYIIGLFTESYEIIPKRFLVGTHAQAEKACEVLRVRLGLPVGAVGYTNA